MLEILLRQGKEMRRDNTGYGKIPFKRRFYCAFGAKRLLKIR